MGLSKKTKKTRTKQNKIGLSKKTKKTRIVEQLAGATHIVVVVVVLYTAESTGASTERTKMPNLRNGSKGGFEPGLT